MDEMDEENSSLQAELSHMSEDNEKLLTLSAKSKESHIDQVVVCTHNIILILIFLQICY